MSESLLVERRGDARWLTLNRPAAHNALDRSLTTTLVTALDEAAGDSAVRAVVLTGAGEKTFCAGADLKEGRGGAARSPFASGEQENPLVPVFRAMRRCPKPVVARVNGAALGGGLGLVSACDLAYAADHARFATPEVKVGLFPLMISTYLIRQIPRRRFWEMAFLGEPLTAAEAQAYHLVNKAVPLAELDACIADVLGRLRAASPTALRMGKRFLELAQDMSADETLAHGAAVLDGLAASDDAREGMAAFAERRPPSWAAAPTPEGGHG